MLCTEYDEICLNNIIECGLFAANEIIWLNMIVHDYMHTVCIHIYKHISIGCVLFWGGCSKPWRHLGKKQLSCFIDYLWIMLVVVPYSMARNTPKWAKHHQQHLDLSSAPPWALSKCSREGLTACTRSHWLQTAETKTKKHHRSIKKHIDTYGCIHCN